MIFHLIGKEKIKLYLKGYNLVDKLVIYTR